MLRRASGCADRAAWTWWCFHPQTSVWLWIFLGSAQSQHRIHRLVRWGHLTIWKHSSSYRRAELQCKQVRVLSPGWRQQHSWAVSRSCGPFQPRARSTCCGPWHGPSVSICPVRQILRSAEASWEFCHWHTDINRSRARTSLRVSSSHKPPESMTTALPCQNPSQACQVTLSNLWASH